MLASDGAARKARDKKVKACSQVKMIRPRRVVLLSPLQPFPLSLYLSAPLSPREADTSLHPFDRSQKEG